MQRYAGLCCGYVAQAVPFTLLSLRVLQIGSGGGGVMQVTCQEMQGD